MKMPRVTTQILIGAIALAYVLWPRIDEWLDVSPEQAQKNVGAYIERCNAAGKVAIISTHTMRAKDWYYAGCIQKGSEAERQLVEQQKVVAAQKRCDIRRLKTCDLMGHETLYPPRGTAARS